MNNSRSIQSVPPGERLFNDDSGKLWCAARWRAARSEDALVFTCLSDARLKPRAVVADRDLELDEAREDLLRYLLKEAPRLGRLEE